MSDEIPRTDEEWRRELTEEEYHILRQKGTEPAFSSPLHNEKRDGVYLCAGCGQALFNSENKFDSGTGWPSFYQPIDEDAVETAPDNSLFISRTEVLCSRCGSHQGHVFEDGPEPTGLRYCINGAALDFEPREE